MKHNIGAIKKIWVFRPNEISLSRVNYTSVLINTSVNTDLRILPFIQQSALPVVEWENDDAGGLWNIKLSGLISKIDAQSRESCSLLKGPGIYVVENFNHEIYVLGSSVSPLMPEAIERSNPEKIADATSYAFEVSGRSTSEPPFGSFDE